MNILFMLSEILNQVEMTFLLVEGGCDFSSGNAIITIQSL